MPRTAKELAFQPCFKMRVVDAKKGKGSFKRKPKHVKGKNNDQ